MKLTSEDVGRRVRYHGMTEGMLGYDDNFRVAWLLPSLSYFDRTTLQIVPEGPNANRAIGEFAVCDDRCGRLFMIPTSHLSPVTKDCWCDACDSWRETACR